MEGPLLTLADVLESLSGARPAGLERPVSAVAIDSRAVQGGELFVALRGERTDGHAFVAEAFQRGALAALVERPVEGCLRHVDLRAPSPQADDLAPPLCLVAPDALGALHRVAAWWRRRFEPVVIGITGSVGKTTTKDAVWSMLDGSGPALRSEGNHNNEIGLPLTLLRLDRSHRWAVLEMGMYAVGEIRALAEIAAPQIGVVTNVGPTHLERLGSLERIAQAKAELVGALPAHGAAVLNFDDPRVRAMASLTRARVASYGLEPGAELRADRVEGRPGEGIRFQLHHEGRSAPVSSLLEGKHSVHTALAAAAVGLAAGLGWEEVCGRLGRMKAGARLRTLAGPHGSTIVDDAYNSSPASALAALDYLADLPGRRIAVLGDMLELGHHERDGHRAVGARAAQAAELLISVGPRARLIGEGALGAGMPPASVVMVDSNDEAIGCLREILSPGDAVLVKGSRGMRMEQVVAAMEATG